MLNRFKNIIALSLALTIVFSQNIFIAAAKSSGTSNRSTLNVFTADDTGDLDSDAVKANFRNVKAGKIGKNNLYRSQHPANGSSRSYRANKLARLYKINTVLNLSDTDKKLNSYFKKNKLDSSYYYRTLYNKRNIYTAGMSSIYKASSYQKKTVECMRFISKRKGPYLVHCEVGRDRTAFVILLMECLMGSTYTYMLNDDMKTFMNREGKGYVEARKKSVLRLNEIFHYITGKPKNTNWGKMNMRTYAVHYLKVGGMTLAEINALKRNLSINYPESDLFYKMKFVPTVWPDSGTVPDGSISYDTASGTARKDSAVEDDQKPDGSTKDSTSENDQKPDESTKDSTAGNDQNPDGSTKDSTAEDNQNPDGSTKDSTSENNQNPDGSTPSP